jgi:hypothetical protein
MFFGLIFLRILFIASMVFIIGYIFGNWSARPALRTLARISTILVIVLFIGTNVLAFRFRAWHGRHFNGPANCGWYQKDSTAINR